MQGGDTAAGGDDGKSGSSASGGLNSEAINEALNASADVERKWKEMENKMAQIQAGVANMLVQLVAGPNEPAEKTQQLLDELTLQGVAKYIHDGKCRNIITMVGAGISTSAGIPDFRSKNTGLYDNLKEYNLPSPSSLFSIDYFKKNPEPFFKIRVRDFYMKVGEYQPTPAHYFIKMLADKGLLLRHYTQNIDTLDTRAGIPEDKTVLAHGSFASWHCLGEDCKTSYTLEWVKKIVNDDKIPRCTKCKSVIRPDIVFFGESLSANFHESVEQDFGKCDLLIILGTSLSVQPFCSLINRVPVNTPRLIINKDKPNDTLAQDAVGSFLGIDLQFPSLLFDKDDNYRDVAYIGTCDDGCYKLASLLGWQDHLKRMVEKEHQVTDEASRGKTHGSKCHSHGANQLEGPSK
ncbi:NAD-dependent protein deacetylase sirtuin-2-like [Saccoglossus kowalevskii]|uniref:NAD-dependent protein deacetylase n=1 Tax=Saccoglossus kowalevskii TaxID=10224 RepID=A0ABM0LTT5_SACKO|nr:PREDICTED: NAD-dependent protein deacetylase sirtuin-2-like [Saccoglossus kowalevskii]